MISNAHNLIIFLSLCKHAVYKTRSVVNAFYVNTYLIENKSKVDQNF